MFTRSGDERIEKQHINGSFTGQSKVVWYQAIAYKRIPEKSDYKNNVNKKHLFLINCIRGLYKTPSFAQYLRLPRGMPAQ